MLKAQSPKENTMFFETKLQQSLTVRSEQIDIYDGTYSILKQHATTLFELRQKSLLALDRAESLTSQTNNCPTYENVLRVISVEKRNFSETQLFTNASVSTSKKTVVIDSIAKAVAPLAKEFAPDVAMWATTFGKASTGKAISELSGIARTNAQLAILGGGAKRIGGKGIAGGKAFLAIVGPLTEVGIICLSGAANLYVRCKENYKRAKQADNEAQNIRQATTVLIDSTNHILDLIKQTDELLSVCNDLLNEIEAFNTADDSSNSVDKAKKMEELISNCSKLSVIINQTI